MRRILIETGFGQTRLALVEGERLIEFRLERGAGVHRPGSLHLGRVMAVDGGLAAAFVEIGAAQPGLLPLRDAGKSPPSQGDAVLVQVTRAPVEDKGVRLSARPALPGRGLALRPGRSGIAFAAGLSDPEQRERIAAVLRPLLPLGCGFSVERAAAGRAEDSLAVEAGALAELWAQLEAAAARRRAPALLWPGLDAEERALLDWGDRDAAILCNDRAVAARAAAFAAERIPELESAPEIRPHPALLEAEGIEEELEAALLPEAPIPGGGFLVIEPGRTLTAIDVNSGGEAAGRRPREVNLAAAAEIARQLRLRAIGGLVVIDYIDLRAPSARGPVLERLAAALAEDPAGCELAGGTRLGLVELTRRRTGPSLAELLTEPCGTGGSGRLPRLETVGHALLRRLAAEALARPGRQLRIRLSPWLAEGLEGPLGPSRGELERRLGRPLVLEPDPFLGRGDAHIQSD